MQTLRRWWDFSGHILAAYVDSVYFKMLFEKLLKSACCSKAGEKYLCVRVCVCVGMCLPYVYCMLISFSSLLEKRKKCSLLVEFLYESWRHFKIICKKTREMQECHDVSELAHFRSCCIRSRCVYLSSYNYISFYHMNATNFVNYNIKDKKWWTTYSDPSSNTTV